MKEESNASDLNKSTGSEIQEASFNSNKYGPKITKEILKWIVDNYGNCFKPI